jgi:lipopolysaccharide/colanic/teichoic acid biosynthesis glycosyltransferase
LATPSTPPRRPIEPIRLLDLAGAGVGLMLLWPLMALLALLVRLTSPGPAFHRATRAGMHGRPFVLFKFRSMTADAPSAGPAITGSGDPRVTPLGKTIRKTKLDEIPQLYNVLRGDMSLVGPRPEDFRYVAKYTREQLAILDTKPGITGAASLEYRDEESLLSGDDPEQRYIEEVMPAKMALDLAYQRHRTVFTDLKLILRTVQEVIGRRRP